MSVLLGQAVMAGLDASALGLTFCQIPAGTYEVGDADYEDNPVRPVQLDAFELAKTPTTNRQLAAALNQLGDQNTVLMFESVKDRRWAIAARGTREEIAGLSMAALREGALRTFDLGEERGKIVSVTLKPHYLLKGFVGGDQPALMSYFESAAVAALYGLILPTGEMWEAAAGDLRDKRYRKEKELRRVAHFQPDADATANVGTKEANCYGLLDMLGNVREWVANRFEERDVWRRETRGASWRDFPVDVRAALRGVEHPDVCLYEFGCRFGRQNSRG